MTSPTLWAVGQEGAKTITASFTDESEALESAAIYVKNEGHPFIIYECTPRKRAMVSFVDMTATDPAPKPVTRRKRRTKAEIEAALDRAAAMTVAPGNAEAAAKAGVDPEIPDFLRQKPEK